MAGVDRARSTGARSLFTLTALGLANRAAYALQYGEGPIEIPAIEKAEPQHRAPDWTLVQWVSNLLYNCRTNGGTDFAPQKHADRLKEWAGIARETDNLDAAIDRAIDQAERRDGASTEAPILALARTL